MNRSDRVTSTIIDSAATTAEQLAVDHIPLVAHLVREVSGRIPASVDRDDLRSAGLVALVAASRAFDPDLGVPFAAYAAQRIRGALLDELRSVDWASRSVRRKGREIEATRQRLAAAMGQFPDDRAVAESLGVPTAEVVRADADVARASVLSIHGTDRDLADEVPTAALGPEALLERGEQLAYLADAIDELPERLQFVVRAYFLEERPMAEIGAELGVTESRVSQLRAEALVLLRGALASALEPHLVEEPANPTGVAARRKAAYAESVQARYAARLRVPMVQTA
ncbi:sigma-70 family RNA polymerase sigma factor [Nocardioides sp. YIM 152315]|uniref:sigma-70 family RNA polymerase sigma factor n=1 Tax=Nocardioides sp. YIM 152315 TaxID=3031760 RepID=UPI0023DB22F7|nr:sigma-70 family RNA polymerase sigma factor [Nocardioides sp. YIM 152315]MDF1603587.1 sigma-70 family RNA polymerase sigma factor [Nocardioides sp. YIM 152315]